MQNRSLDNESSGLLPGGNLTKTLFKSVRNLTNSQKQQMSLAKDSHKSVYTKLASLISEMKLIEQKNQLNQESAADDDKK